MKQPTAPRHPFRAGSNYRNRLGDYVVLSLDEKRGRMKVRFLPDGPEREFDIKTQERIWENVQRDELDEQEEANLPEPPVKGPPGHAFQGMKEADFRGTSRGTSWRRRDMLAGALAARLTHDLGRRFTARPGQQGPVIHLTHRPSRMLSSPGTPLVRFTVQALPEGLCYGLQLQRTHEGGHDWRRLLQRLASDPDLRRDLKELEAGDVRVEARKGKGAEPPLYRDDSKEAPRHLWPEKKRPSVRKQIDLLGAPCPKGEWRELYMVRLMPPAEAVARGVDLTDDLASLFVRLASYYDAAVENVARRTHRAVEKEEAEEA